MTKTNPTVMVIEDEHLLLKAITKKLHLEQFNTLSCTSGEQALDYLKNLTDLPQVIWLDYYLKDTNGLEFMRQLKQNERWSQIPVVVVSNSASPDKVHNMLALGAKKYLLKAEHRLDDIIDVVSEFISSEVNKKTE